jgi:hypothetical protein
MKCHFSLSDIQGTYFMTEEPMGLPDRDVAQSQALLREIKKKTENLSGVITEETIRETVRNEERGPRHYGGGWTSSLEHINAVFPTAAATIAFTKIAKDLLLQWLKNKRDRSITFSKGNLTIEVKGDHDISRILQELAPAVELEGKSSEANTEAIHPSEGKTSRIGHPPT